MAEPPSSAFFTPSSKPKKKQFFRAYFSRRKQTIS